MISYLTHSQIDKSRWDECVTKCPDALPYVWSWYLDVVHPGWEALVEDDYQAVMPLCSNKKFGISYLFQPYFTQKFGVFSKNGEANIKAFLQAIPKKFKFTEFRINSADIISVADGCVSVKPHRNIELCLSSDYSDLASNYHSNTKRNISKAQKDNLTIDESADPEEIIKLFRNNRGREIDKWGDTEYSRLQNLVEVAKDKGHCLVYGVKNSDDKLIAGAFFMTSHNKIVFLFSGTDESNKNTHGLSFLLDYVIKKYAGTDKILDFEGSDNDGLARYYKGFGGNEKNYQEIKLNQLNIFYKFALRIFKRNKI